MAIPNISTPRDICTIALVKCGILGQGRSASGPDIQNALTDLCSMLALWNRKRWMKWDTVTIVKTSTGADTYTAGPGGDFPMSPRPNRIKAAFLRNLVASPGLQVDTPVQVIQSIEDYDRIALKTLVSYTKHVFLDTQYPLAIVRPYPVPSANVYALGLSFEDVLPALDLDTDLSTMPDEYMPAMYLNLAIWLRQAYGKGLKPDPELNKLAKAALSTIKDANLQIPELVLPAELVGDSPGYNILSDQF